jgi:hypothetical protein
MISEECMTDVPSHSRRTRKTRRVLATASLAFLALIAGLTAQADDLPAAQRGARYAFLVGASSYLYGSQVGLADLKYSDDDAVAFGDALVDLGWPVANADGVVQGEAGAGVRSRIVAPADETGNPRTLAPG